MKLSRIGLELRQYGFHPDNLCKVPSGDWLTDQHLPAGSTKQSHANPPYRVLANSIPKSGTNLLLRALYLTRRYTRTFRRTLQSSHDSEALSAIRGISPGKFLASHLKYSEALTSPLSEYSTRHVLMVRVPRDMAVSIANYITKIDKKHRLHDYFCHQLTTDADRISAAIKGISSQCLNDRESLSLKNHLDGYSEWQKTENILVLRFEDLIGEAGGSSTNVQRECLTELYQYLGFTLSNQEMSAIQRQLYSSASRTFHRGQIGTWKGTLNSRHLEEISKMSGLMEDWGYHL